MVERRNRRPIRWGSLTLVASVALCCRTPLLVSAQPPAPAASQPAEASVAELVQLVIGNPNTPQTRAFGARQLIRIASPEATDALASILKDGEPAAVLAVSQAVADMPDAAPASLIEPLVGLLKADPAEIRESAINALARYADDDVAERVAKVASDAKARVAYRLAAIEVLRRRAGEKQAVDALVALVEDPDPQIRALVFRSLRLVSQQDFGSDPEAARRWWAEHRDRPSEQRWRAILQQREAELAAQTSELRELRKRYLGALRELFDQSPADVRLARLRDYLADPLPQVRAMGASLVATMVADRMEIPQGIVQTLGALVGDEAVEVRRTALAAVRDLRDPTLAPILTARWEAESNTDVRKDLLAALGRLGNPEVIPFLITRVTEEADPALAATAAASLGLLAAKNNETVRDVLPAVTPLASLFERLDPGQAEARAKVADAMAMMGDPQFAPTFMALLGDEKPALRSAAVKGLMNVGDRQYLTSVIARLEDEDAGVRAAAVEAVSRLGNELTHADALMARTSPQAEPNEAVRAAAWEGCLKILRGRPVEEQLAWSRRIDPRQDRASAQRLVAVLYPIVKEASAGRPQAELAEMNARLGTALGQLDRHEEGAAALQQALDFYLGREDPKAVPVGVELALCLMAIDQSGRAVQILSELSERWPGTDWDPTWRAIREHLSRQLASGQVDGVITSAESILAASPRLLDDEARSQIVELLTSALASRADQDRHWVETWLNETHGPEEQGDKAEREIQQLGDRAVPAVAAVLCDVIAEGQASDTSAENEQRCLQLLKELRPDWVAYDPDAGPEQKLEALAPLLSPPSSQPANQG